MFDARKVKNDIVQWIREWFIENGKGCNAVVGISGGKDSSIVAALCVEALGKDRVIGVLLPNGVQNDISDAFDLVNHLNIKYIVYDIRSAFFECQKDVLMHDPNHYTRELNPVVWSEQTKINLPARIRMAMLYAISQSYNGRVANTCNLSEDWIGYSTRYGDAAGDFAPLACLTSEEVVAIGAECGLPHHLVYKTPSDGLCGKTDEDNFGFTYAALNRYIRTGICDDEEVQEKIDFLHRKNKFKLKPIPKFEYIV